MRDYVYDPAPYRTHPHVHNLHFIPGQTFQSATAFSIYCKRLQTPGKQGDDGWKSVHYEGVPLGDIRSRFMERFPDGTIPAHAIPSAAPTAASSRVMADTDTSRDSVGAADEDDEDDVMADAGAAANVRRRCMCRNMLQLLLKLFSYVCGVHSHTTPGFVCRRRLATTSGCSVTAARRGVSCQQHTGHLWKTTHGALGFASTRHGI